MGNCWEINKGKIGNIYVLYNTNSTVTKNNDSRKRQTKAG